MLEINLHLKLSQLSGKHWSFLQKLLHKFNCMLCWKHSSAYVHLYCQLPSYCRLHTATADGLHCASGATWYEDSSHPGQHRALTPWSLHCGLYGKPLNPEFYCAAYCAWLRCLLTSSSLFPSWHYVGSHVRLSCMLHVAFTFTANSKATARKVWCQSCILSEK